MGKLVDFAISHARLTLATLIFLLVAGFSAYQTIPKEAEPDVQVPIIYANIKEMRSSAYEGGGYVLLEFEAGFDGAKALADVRAKVDDARRDLPRDADEPQVREVNLSLFPVLVVALGGDVPERTLLRLARLTKTAIEQVPGVLQAELRGARDEAVEIIAEPMLLHSYGLALDDLVRSFAAGNSLIAAGAVEGASGRFAVKVPALIETAPDMLKYPIAATG